MHRRCLNASTSSQSPKLSKHVRVLGRRRGMTASGWTNPRTRSQLSIRLGCRQEQPLLSSRVCVARDRCHSLRELWSGEGFCSSADVRGRCRGLSAGLLALVIEQPQILGLSILSRWSRIQSSECGVHVCSDIVSKGPSSLDSISIDTCADDCSLPVPVSPSLCPASDCPARGCRRYRRCPTIPNRPSTSPSLPMMMVMITIVFGVLGATPESVSLTPSGTLAILPAILGLATTPTFGKLAGERFPTTAEH